MKTIFLLIIVFTSIPVCSCNIHNNLTDDFTEIFQQQVQETEISFIGLKNKEEENKINNIISDFYISLLVENGGEKNKLVFSNETPTQTIKLQSKSKISIDSVGYSADEKNKTGEKTNTDNEAQERKAETSSIIFSIFDESSLIQQESINQDSNQKEIRFSENLFTFPGKYFLRFCYFDHQFLQEAVFLLTIL